MTDEERKARIEAVNGALNASDESALLLGGGDIGHPPEAFAEAILGIIWTPRVSVAYLESKVIEVFMRENAWDEDTAREWYEYNTVRSIQYLSDVDNPPTLVEDLVY